MRCLAAILVLLVAAASTSAPSTPIPGVWPQPASTVWTPGSEAAVQFSGVIQDFFVVTGQSSVILASALVRYAGYSFPSGPSAHAAGASSAGVITGLAIHVIDASTELSLDTDESYSLAVPASGVANLTANSVYGALRGLETFSQLVYYQLPLSNQYTIPNVPLTITDAPRFRHRGLLVDTARHYLSVQTILEVLVGMEASKLNVLHWHITDDQSFPYNSSTFPLLAQKGAYLYPYAIFGAADVAEVIAFAAARGIRVVPEFDLPGHSRSWLQGYPSLQGSSLCPIIDPTLPSTLDFMGSFYAEIAGVFNDQYLHTGGDEVDLECWASPQIAAWLQEKGFETDDYAQVENYYEAFVQKTMSALNKSTIVWEEVFENNVTLSPGSVVEVWKGASDRNDFTQTLSEVTAAGHFALLSAPWYLDHLQDTWATYYEIDVPTSSLSPAQVRLVLGGEASMWGEMVDGTNIIERIFPRASAVAEVLWSPDSFVKNATVAANRLANFRCRLVTARGLVAEPVGSNQGTEIRGFQGEYCAPLMLGYMP